jgi:hypothetical protein
LRVVGQEEHCLAGHVAPGDGGATPPTRTRALANVVNA